MLQLEEGTIDLFSKLVEDNGLVIDMEVVEKPRTIDEYVQAWHNQIWEHGFMGWFKGKESYSKTHLRTTGTRILPSSTWSSSMNSFLRYHLFPSLPTCA
jgi:hypothetical protein